MSRLIDADAMIKDLHSINPIYGYDIRRMEFIVNAQPTIDAVEVKHGEWLKRKIKEHQFVQNGYELYYRSVCDKNYHDVSGFDFCPNCGADMRGDQE